MKKFDFGFGEFLSFMTLTEVDGGEPSTSGELGGKLIPAKQVLSPAATARSVRETSRFFDLFVCFLFPGHGSEHRSFVVP